MACLESCFGELSDPRAGNTTHRLGDLLVMMVAASLCGASTATEFSLFAETRKAVLSRLISYDHAPSHDTFSRLLRLLDPKAFGRAFAAFATGFSEALAQGGFSPAESVVAIDGKVLKRAYERGLVNSPPLMVSAFAAQARLCLAVTSASGENEVEAALRVVELLDLTNKIVTADALHCHHRMAEAITGKGGGFLLALKGNRHQWHATAEQLFASDAFRSKARTMAFAHDRLEQRRAEVIAAPPLMKGHAAFVRIITRRNQAPPVSRLFMASKNFSAEEALAITRAHWQIENNLHWMLDVHFAEDLSRARKDNAPANIAILKRIARNILQTADKPKVPISHRIKKCAWDDAYLTHAITHMR